MQKIKRWFTLGGSVLTLFMLPYCPYFPSESSEDTTGFVVEPHAIGLAVGAIGLR